MGIGHKPKLPQQKNLFQINWKHRHSYGGILRNQRIGRGQRPLSTKDPLHLVFKIDKIHLSTRSLRSPRCFGLVRQIIKQYSQLFFIKVEQISIQNDHLHLLVRTPKRCQFHFFFRVVAGQIAQRFKKEGLISAFVTDTPHTKRPSAGWLWKHRPFTRVVKGFRSYKIVRNYIQLNEMEARGKIPYQKQRLKGLSSSDWELLWK